jgi:hypothetical protein
MPIRRRTFLTAAALTPLALTATAAPAFRMPDTCPPLDTTALPLRLYSIGRDGATLAASGAAMAERPSVLTEFDLKTGRLRQTLVPVQNGHSVMGLPRQGWLFIASSYGKQVAVIDRESHAVVRTMQAPNGFVYSGHTLELPERNLLLTSLYREVATTTADEGLFQLFDATTLNEVGQVPSGGLQPHEMLLRPGGTEIVVANQGSTQAPSDEGYTTARRFTFDALDPKLTVLDTATLKVKRTIPLTPENGVPTHLTFDTKGRVVAVTQQYLNMTPAGDRTREVIARELDDIRRPQGWPLHWMDLERPRGNVALPMPLVRADLDTGAVETFMSDPAMHRRSQSVITHTQSGRVFAIYMHSNALVYLDEDGTCRAIPCQQAGVNDIIGLADLPGTPYIAAQGFYYDIGILHAQTLQLVASFKVNHFRSAHLTVA